jgi:L-seryl-tRNA(Ser) seleniumtransferase
MVGGGSMPTEKIDTYVLKVKSAKFTPEELEKKLRENSTPIIVRIYSGCLYLDLRTIFDKDFEVITEAFTKIMQRG